MSTYKYWDIKRKFKDEFIPVKLIIYIWNPEVASLVWVPKNNSPYC